MIRWSLVVFALGVLACSGGDSDGPTGAADVTTVADATGVSPADTGSTPQDGGVGIDTSGLSEDIGQEDAGTGLGEISVPDVTVAVDVSDGDLQAPPQDVASADTGGEPTPQGPPAAPDPLPAGLSGQAPPADKDTGPPSLAGVLDTTGTPPKDTDLIGHWSVLWFYPAASTSG